ncbi:MAG: hypothetical protein R8L07_03640 [Alphaproteobacteria bacterium]|nr:hypothetical protein [Alphaproteobacteria bacterium]
MIPQPIADFPRDADMSTECYAVYNACNGWSILDWPEHPEDLRTSRVWTHWLHLPRPDAEMSVNQPTKD